MNAEILKRYTNDTYVETLHPTWFYYVGNVSVKGSDWIQTLGAWKYPTYSKVTYKHPNGTLQFKRVNSFGMSDAVVRKGSITVGDSLIPWAETTKSYWDIGLGNRPVNPGDPVPDTISDDIE